MIYTPPGSASTPDPITTTAPRDRVDPAVMNRPVSGKKDEDVDYRMLICIRANQQIEAMNTATGEVVGRRLIRRRPGRAVLFTLPKPVRVGVEATGYGWFEEQLLQKCGHELWVIEARGPDSRRGSTSSKNSVRGLPVLLLRLLAEDRFPRIWIAPRNCATRVSYFCIARNW